MPLLAIAALLVAPPGAVQAQDGQLWIQRDGGPRPYDGGAPAAHASRPDAVERGTLPPIDAAPAAPGYGGGTSVAEPPIEPARGARVGQGGDLWQGFSFTTLRDRLLKLDGAGGSRVLNNLAAWAVLQEGGLTEPADQEMRELLKLVVLYRMGRIDDLIHYLEQGSAPQSLPARLFHARGLLARGDTDKGCELAARFPVNDPGVPNELLAEVVLTSGYCAARRKDLQGAGLMADLARDRGIQAPIAYAVIDYLSTGVRPRMDIPARLGVRDYLFLSLTGAKPPQNFIDLAEPALVYALAHDAATPPALRVEAAERAARNGAMDAAGLAAVYKDVAAAAHGGGQRSDGETRALLFDAVVRSGDPQHRAKVIDTLLANARKVRLAAAYGPLLAPHVRDLPPSPELAWFAPRAVEVALLAHDLRLMESWLLFAREAGRDAYAAAEWLPLVELVERGLVPLDEASEMTLRMARGRRLAAEHLHLLASVLDALSINVPIPLWDEAGKHPQPNKGKLPAGGMLSVLQTASEARRGGEVLLIALDAVQHDSPEALHLIALGDIVRALHRAGFAAEAGWFGFEALYYLWPTGQARIAAGN